MDWGDLPASYDTNAENPDGPGPSHVVVPWFRLGSNIDGEVAGIPTADATGDDTTGGSNNGPDDGVIIENNGGRLVVGDNTLHVTVFGVGGLLTGWMDFNNNGHFDSNEKLTWSLNGTSLGQEADINEGSYDLHITVPASASTGSD